MANTGNDEGANANKYTLSLSSTPTTVVEPQEKTTHGDRAEGQSTRTSSDAVVPAAAAAAAAAASSVAGRLLLIPCELVNSSARACLRCLLGFAFTILLYQFLFSPRVCFRSS